MPIAIKSDTVFLSSENNTEELANKILKKIKIGDIVFLYGEMGVGKTTFVKYLIHEFQKIKNILFCSNQLKVANKEEDSHY